MRVGKIEIPEFVGRWKIAPAIPKRRMYFRISSYMRNYVHKVGRMLWVQKWVTDIANGFYAAAIRILGKRNLIEWRGVAPLHERAIKVRLDEINNVTNAALAIGDFGVCGLNDFVGCWKLRMGGSDRYAKCGNSQ